MTISLEDVKKMHLVGIRTSVPMKPIQKDLRGITFPIKALVDKEIIVIDWVYLDKGSKINSDKKCVKIQFYIGDMLGVCFTSSDDFVTSLENWYHDKGDKIVPFPTRVRSEGRRFYMEDIENE